MAAIHDALKSLTPIDFTTLPTDEEKLKEYLTAAFKAGQLLIDSIPIPSPTEVESSLGTSGRSRANTGVSIASSASEITVSSARPTPPPSDVEGLQKQWGKPMRLNPRENPLGMSVYKLAGKDGKGAWFGRRSIHEGLGFRKWKAGLEREFPETLKVQGEPGEGNIRGIGGERRLEYKVVEGVGTIEVYHLSAKFPGPTTPRDFVTLLLTSDAALSENAGGVTEEHGVPRHFMVVSIPCIHPDAPEREGFIRGQYQSVEFIREVPVKKGPKRSVSTTNFLDGTPPLTLGKQAALRNAKNASHPSAIKEEGEEKDLSDTESKKVDTRRRSKTISFTESRGADAKGERYDLPQEIDETETNPVEWIMLTRSDPGGSVPRFMVERGTPSSIVADASKFLDWACTQDPDEFEEPPSEEDGDDLQLENSTSRHQRRELSEVQTNGHLAGVDGSRDPPPIEEDTQGDTTGGIYGMVFGAANAAGSLIADYIPGSHANQSSDQDQDRKSSLYRSLSHQRRYSSSSSSSSVGSFASALEGNSNDTDSISDREATSSLKSQTSSSIAAAARRATTAQEKELQKLEERKQKLADRLAKTKEKELSKKSEDAEKEQRELAKAEEKHAREVAKQEEKYKREVAKLEAKRVKEEKRLEEKKRKTEEKDERTRLARELEEMRVERDLLRKERQILRLQVMELQAENTGLAARIGKLGTVGRDVLSEVRAEVKGSEKERKRASSLRGLKEVGRVGSGGSLSSGLGNGNGNGSPLGTPRGSVDVGGEEKAEKK